MVPRVWITQDGATSVATANALKAPPSPHTPSAYGMNIPLPPPLSHSHPNPPTHLLPLLDQGPAGAHVEQVDEAAHRHEPSWESNKGGGQAVRCSIHSEEKGNVHGGTCL